MKQAYKSIILLIVVIGFVGCTDEDITSREYSRLKSKEVNNITESGAQFNAEILYQGEDQIEEYGFVWATDENPGVSFSDKIVFVGEPEGNGFSAKATAAMIKDEKYYVKPYIITNNHTVYGTAIEFISQGCEFPVIESFTPQTAQEGEIVEINGRNFSYLNYQDVVMFGTQRANVINATDTKITVLVPEFDGSNSFNLVVNVLGQADVSQQVFTYLQNN